MSLCTFADLVPISEPSAPPAYASSVGVFDSGLGGLSVMRHLRPALPDTSLVYLADSARSPYGGQSTQQLVTYSVQIAELLTRDYGCDALVVACNTATAAAIQVLRARFTDLPIVGMEPAVKPAARATRSGVVGVMATAGTIGSEKYARLLRRFGREIRVVEDPCVGLVELIEAGQLEGPVLEDRLRSVLRPMLDAGVDAIVLGCTHFPLIADAIQGVVGPSVKLIDPAPAVVREVVRQVVAGANAGPIASTTFITSGDRATFRQSLKLYVPRLLAGATVVAHRWGD